MSKYDPSTEYGSTGLRYYGGDIVEEFLRELDGSKKFRTLREMADNSPIIGGMVYCIDKIISGVSWHVNPGEMKKNTEDAEFLESNMHDMSSSWRETISMIVTPLIRDGFSYNELVYKRRLGQQPDPKRKSKFTDGKIGWRKIPGRAGETIADWNGWDLDEDGGVKGVFQVPPPMFQRVYIPIEKALLFRTSAEKNNPEGRPLIRNAYRPWYFMKNIENTEAIGIERDLAGLPVAYVPHKWLAESASAEETAAVEEVKKIVRNVRRDEQEGIVWPVHFDEHGNKDSWIELLNSGGKRNFDTNQIIMRYAKFIALTILADVILLGVEGKGGSLAMAKEKSSFLTLGISSILDSITDIFNRHGTPRLFTFNGKDITDLPQMAHGGVKAVDLQIIGNFLKSMVDAGVIDSDPKLEEYARAIANAPARED